MFCFVSTNILSTHSETNFGITGPAMFFIVTKDADSCAMLATCYRSTARSPLNQSETSTGHDLEWFDDAARQQLARIENSPVSL